MTPILQTDESESAAGTGASIEREPVRRSESRPAPSRAVAVAAMGAVSLVAPWLIAALLGALRSVDDGILPSVDYLAAAALAATAIRGCSVAARWNAWGPGSRIDRRLWANFFAAMTALAPIATGWQGAIVFAVPLFCHYLTQTVFWYAEDAGREQEAFRSARQQVRFGLRDAFVALAMFGVLAGAVRWGMSGLSRVDPIAVLFSIGGLAFVSLILSAVMGTLPFLLDVGIRRYAHWPDDFRRRAIQASISTAILALACVGGYSLYGDAGSGATIVIAFVATYLFYAAAQEAALIAAGVDPKIEGPSTDANRTELR